MGQMLFKQLPNSPNYFRASLAKVLVVMVVIIAEYLS